MSFTLIECMNKVERPVIFFRPVFNIEDSSITIGVLMMIIFQKQFFKK